MKKKPKMTGKEVTCYEGKNDGKGDSYSWTDADVANFFGTLTQPCETFETNSRGGKGSKIYGDMTEVPPLALLEVSKVMKQGLDRYPREDGCPNWHKTSCRENLNHALEHAIKFIDLLNKPVGDRDWLDEHRELSHAAARMLMALEQYIREDLDEVINAQEKLTNDNKTH